MRLRLRADGAQFHTRFGSHAGAGIQTDYTGFGEAEQDTTTVGGVTRTIERTFDANGNRTRITHPDGQFFTYNFDGLNRLDSIEDTSGNLLIADTYDPFARPESRVTAGNAITTVTYGSISRLNTIGFQFSGTADDLTLGFGYNPAGQLANQTVSNSEYHHSGGIGKTGDYAVNGLNQYASVGGIAFTYDANGNLTDDGPNTYTYDAENRLISVSGSNSASLSYDPMGRLYRYTVNGTTTDFLYDGDSLIAEYQGSTLTKRYVHGISTDTPLVSYTGSTVGTTNRQFLHRNHQGSVIAITDNGGNVIDINTYDAYGVPASGNSGRFGYTGQVYLPELKLYYYRARVYNPDFGRFLQVDPVGYADQINMYAYAYNDPMNFIDPSGMRNCSPGDDSCVETPESEEMPGEPEPKSDEVEKMEEVVVTAHKINPDGLLNFADGLEHSFTVSGEGIVPAPIKSLGSVYCGRGLYVEPHAVSVPRGATLAHTHPDFYGAPGSVPGPADNRAAITSNANAAFTITSANVFTIEAMSNGTYRTTVVSGPALSANQMADLVANMKKWENPPPKTTKNPSKRSLYCP